jgi:hypothetical protein
MRFVTNVGDALPGVGDLADPPFSDRWRHAPSLHFWCRRRKQTAEQPSRRAAASVIRYLFDSGIITMHDYDGNQQKGHIAKA